jgi:hypothetical protein
LTIKEASELAKLGSVVSLVDDFIGNDRPSVGTTVELAYRRQIPARARGLRRCLLEHGVRTAGLHGAPVFGHRATVNYLSLTAQNWAGSTDQLSIQACLDPKANLIFRFVPKARTLAA